MKKTLIAMALTAMTAVPTMAQNKSGIDVKNLDKTVRAQDDFYQFACGGWMKNNPLPAAYSRFGSFDVLRLNNNKRINSILNDLQKKKFKTGTLEQKIADLYRLAMDSVRRNNEGVEPAMYYINGLEGAKSKKELQEIQLEYSHFGVGKVYGAYYGADEKDSKTNILNIYQGGLSLGQKEYYLDNDDATAHIRAEYKKHIVRMFKLFGFSETESQAKMNAIMRIETTLAIASKSKTELRDVEKNYNKTTLANFEKNYPNLMLTAFETAKGVKKEHIETLIVGQPEFLTAADKVVEQMTTDELRAYMEWDVIQTVAPYLSDDVDATMFEFVGKVMSGRKQDYERWKKATDIVEGVLGDALGKIYCERYFPEASKVRMQTLVANLQTSLGERIKAQDWMSEETKAAALDKLSTFYVKIGYPDTWKDMSNLTIDADKSLLENILAARLFATKQRLEETVGKPVNRDEWHMTPQTVNAYYNPTTNEICFPAGILQPPFFDAKADDAFNYGAIGVVIGHEMTHGFDDQGSHYDKEGNMKDWWKAEDVSNFNARSGEFANWFSRIEVLPGLNANGQMTLGENIADHGGLEVSYNAYKNATKNAPLKTIDGFTGDQRFFLAYAGVWGGNITEAEIRNRTRTDVHSLGKWRVNGALPHINAFYEAFGIKETDKMFIPSTERLKLW